MAATAHLLPLQTNITLNATFTNPVPLWTKGGEPTNALGVLCKKCLNLSTLPRTIAKSVINSANSNALGDMLHRFVTGNYDHATTHATPETWIECHSKNSAELAESITSTLGSKAIPYIVVEYVYAISKTDRIARRIAAFDTIEHIKHTADTILRPSYHDKKRPSIETLQPPISTPTSIYSFWVHVEQNLSPRKHLPGRYIESMATVCHQISNDMRLGGGVTDALMDIIGWPAWKHELTTVNLKKLPVDTQMKLCAAASIRQELMATSINPGLKTKNKHCFVICKICRQLLTPVKGLSKGTVKGVVVNVDTRHTKCSVCNNTDLVLVSCKNNGITIARNGKIMSIETCTMCKSVSVCNHRVGIQCICTPCNEKLSWTPSICFCRRPTKAALKPFACLINSKIVISAACPSHANSIPSTIEELSDIAARVGEKT